MAPALDWSAYANYGQGDAYAGIPARGGHYARAVAVCIGNRQCQRSAGKGVMCPSFRLTGEAQHSTRGRVEALKAVLNGEGADIDFDDPQLAAAMDLCLGCKGCKKECPNGVDMALLRTEYLAQRAKKHGLAPRERLFAHGTRWLERWPWLGTLIRLRNRLPLAAALGERWLGVARARALPEPARIPFAAPLPAEATAERPPVALLVDSFTRHFEPDNARAAIEVLSAAGYAVQVLEPATGDATPQRSLCCGRSLLSAGLVEEARAEARRLVAALAPAIAAGTPVVGLEPSCLYMLRDEYHSLGLGADVDKLARLAFLFEEFVAREHAAGRFRLAFGPLEGEKVLVHGHCHQKAYGGMKPLKKALALIPQLDLEIVEAGCCGMAGSFGHEAEHHALSLQMAEAELLPALRAAPDATVVADGFSCRQQIHDGAARRAVHAAVLMRRAMP
ncbi:(Fe-S)-binding protein [Pseudothauera rhizosphaerae]|uniref:(Fe-S)-binding protein n=2 Tax=Pseudothauera rhizosphaerae TaxID=2565932 RepID=A0A4S4AJB2_9RHOO|nr:(Fe-S)-binding protein [Pseudothauera rhizosphaerae]